MKIAIVTQPLSNNFGGILQNYALQNVLKRLGHEPITFNVVPQRIGKRYWLKHTAKWLLFKFILNRKEKYENLYYRRDKKMRRFVKKHINLTPIKRDYKGFDVKGMKCDAIIVGSDQVWRKLYNTKVWEDKFLNFAKTLDIKRIAYAASWGSDKCEFCEEELNVAHKLIKKFNAVSVRESSGVKLTKESLGVDSIEVLDPTMLLNRDDYAKVSSKSKLPSVPYLAAYILDDEEEKIKLINHIAKDRGLKVEYFGIGKNKMGVEEWLAMFAHAEFVVTDSFHGTVFSIINHRPFVTIANARRGLARFSSLLKKFELESRIIDSIDAYKALLEIDWLQIEQTLNEWRYHSLKFLKMNLS